jgi:hypothetical protein
MLTSEKLISTPDREKIQLYKISQSLAERSMYIKLSLNNVLLAAFKFR